MQDLNSDFELSVVSYVPDSVDSGVKLEKQRREESCWDHYRTLALQIPHSSKQMKQLVTSDNGGVDELAYEKIEYVFGLSSGLGDGMVLIPIAF